MTLKVYKRINNLTENTSPKWGKMNVAQMLKHSQLPFGVINGTIQMKTKVGFLKN